MTATQKPLVPPAIPSWVRELFMSIDRQDAKSFASFITEDGQFRYGSNPGVHGRKNIAEFVAGFFASMNGLSHTLLNVWEQPGVVVVEGAVKYQLKDGRTVEVPFCNLLKMQGVLVKDYLVFTDPTPMLPPAK